MESNQHRDRPQLVDWDLAASTAARLTPAGPQLGAAEIAATVANLRELADVAVEHVHRITGLDSAQNLRDSQVLIVDRAAWAKANSRSFRVLMEPALDRLAETRGQQLSAGAAAVSGAVTGAQFGAILSFLAGKVLGQYDPFASLAAPSAPAAGRLMFVAPNIVAVERELNVDPNDFRLWVALHEQTHRVQFAAAPWLRDHMLEHISQLTAGLVTKAETLQERLGEVVRSLGVAREAATRGGTAETDAVDGVPPTPAGLLSLLQSPEDKERLSHLTAVMSLLEGHANVVMDAVGPEIVPSVKTIRQRFNDRGQHRGALENWLRRVLGLEAKARQYRDGAKFVRTVVDRVGMDGFNRVWADAGNLPTEAEIHRPGVWIERMGL